MCPPSPDPTAFRRNREGTGDRRRRVHRQQLARRLLADGHDVVGVDALTDYYDPPIKRSNLRRADDPRFRFVEADLNTLDLAPLLADAEVVFHQAGQPGVRASWGGDFAATPSDNVSPPSACSRRHGSPGASSASSTPPRSSVYGNAERYPTDETDRPQPVSPYGVTKLAAEHLCTLYAHNYGAPDGVAALLHRLRPAAAARHGLHQLLPRRPRGAPFPLYGDGEQSATSPTSTTWSRRTCGSTPTGACPRRSRVQRRGRHVRQRQRGHRAPGGDLGARRSASQRSAPVPGDVLRTGGTTAAIRRPTGWDPRSGCGRDSSRAVPVGHHRPRLGPARARHAVRR